MDLITCGRRRWKMDGARDEESMKGMIPLKQSAVQVGDNV